MNIEEIYSNCLDLSISELDNLKDKLQWLRNEKFNNTYKVVEIYPGERIESKVTEATGFYYYHKHSKGYSMGRGTHYIVIPIEKYSDSLNKELIEKYDDKWA